MSTSAGPRPIDPAHVRRAVVADMCRQEGHEDEAKLDTVNVLVEIAMRMDRLEAQAAKEWDHEQTLRQINAAPPLPPVVERPPAPTPMMQPPAPTPVARPVARPPAPVEAAEPMDTGSSTPEPQDMRLVLACQQFYEKPGQHDVEYDALQHYLLHQGRLACTVSGLEQSALEWATRPAWTQSPLYSNSCPESVRRALLCERDNPAALAEQLDRWLQPIEHAGTKMTLIDHAELSGRPFLGAIDPRTATLRSQLKPLLANSLLFRHPFLPELVQAQLEGRSSEPHPLRCAPVMRHERLFTALADGWSGPSHEILQATAGMPFLGEKHCVGPLVDGVDSVERTRDRYLLLCQLQAQPLPSLQDLYNRGKDPWKALFPDTENAQELLFPSHADSFLWLEQHLAVLNYRVEKWIRAHPDNFFPADTRALEEKHRCTRDQLLALWHDYLSWRYRHARLWHRMAASFCALLFQPSCQSVRFTRICLFTPDQMRQNYPLHEDWRQLVTRQLNESCLQPLVGRNADEHWHSPEYLWAALMLHDYHIQYAGGSSKRVSVNTRMLVASPVHAFIAPKQLLQNRDPRPFKYADSVPVSAALRCYQMALRHYAAQSSSRTRASPLPHTLWADAVQQYQLLYQAELDRHEALMLPRTTLQYTAQVEAVWWRMVEVCKDKEQPAGVLSKRQMMLHVIQWFNQFLPAHLRRPAGTGVITRLSAEIGDKSFDRSIGYRPKPDTALARWYDAQIAAGTLESLPAPGKPGRKPQQFGETESQLLHARRRERQRLLRHENRRMTPIQRQEKRKVQKRLYWANKSARHLPVPPRNPEVLSDPEEDPNI